MDTAIATAGDLPLSEDGRLYSASDFSAHPISRTHSLITSGALSQPRVMLNEVVHVLMACRPPRTLDGHVEYLRTRANAPDGALVAPVLRRLVNAGLMVPPASDSAAVLNDRSLPPISSLVIIASHDAGALDRCLSLFVRSLQRRSDATRIVVIDGASSSALADEKRAIVSRHAPECVGGVQYVGPAERLQLRSRLIACGADADVVDFAIGPNGHTGWLKNVLLLLTAGERVLMVSDDCSGGVEDSSVRPEAVTVSGIADLYQYEFLDERAAPDFTRVDVDLIAAHDTILSRSLMGVCQISDVGCDTVAASRRLVALLSDGSAGGRVRLTLPGTIGRLREHPFRLLFRRGDAQQQLASRADAYDRALAFREVRRVVDRLILTDGYETSILCAGLDNTAMLPPIIPAGTGSDEAFSGMLRICDPRAVTAHLPHAVIDDAAAERFSGDPTIQSAMAFSAGEVLNVLAASCCLPIRTRTAVERLLGLGQHFAALGSLDPGELCEIVREGLLDIRCRELASMDAVVSQPGCPTHLVGGFASYRAAFMSLLQQERWLLPQGDDPSGQLTVDATHRLVRQFGRMVTEWPEWRAVATGDTMLGVSRSSACMKA